VIKPIRNGLIAIFGLILFYFVVMGISSKSWTATISQFKDLWYWMLLLSGGFGIQIGLYTHLKKHIKKPVIQQIIHHGEGQQPIDIKKIAKALGAFIVPEVPCCDNPEVVPQNVITDSKFKTFGCGSAIASSSLATEWLKGKTIEEAEKIKNTDIVSELKLPPVKIHCSILAEDAIKAAIADFKEKQKNQTQQNKAG